MNLQNVEATVLVGVGDLYFTVNAAGSQESVIKDVNTVGCHNNFDVVGRFESIQLIQKFKHGALHFRVTSTTALNAGATYRIDFVHENDAGSVLPRHHKHLTHKTGALTNVLLNEF
jgi:hypothetical protein